MVLKRFVILALGALGLGALAAGPTFAQQIPAPDAYEDSLACQTAVKKTMAASGTTHPLDGSIKEGALTETDIAMLTAMAAACSGDPVGDGISEVSDLYEAVEEAQADYNAAKEAYEEDD